jgi:predicted transcriptional regulator
MKTTVSIPDAIAGQVERLARIQGRSMGQVISAALREYAARHSRDEVKEAMNRVADRIAQLGERVAVESTRRILARSEW